MSEWKTLVQVPRGRPGAAAHQHKHPLEKLKVINRITWLCRRRRSSWWACGRRHHRLRGWRATLLRSRRLWLLWPARPGLLLYPSAGVGPVHRRLPAWSTGARLPVALAPCVLRATHSAR